MTQEKHLIKSIIESNQKFKIKVLSESTETSEVDGKYILARASGPAFFPNTTSRNNVFYPKEAWENAIADEEFQHRLKNRLVFGTIGHDPEITDNEVRKGEFSHIVTKVWIGEDDIGYAEYLVLNTEPGRILNTLLRAGVGISVSTKGYGTTIETSDKDTEMVDPDNFSFDRIDFVIDPGYLQAKPELKESKNTENTNYNRNEQKMDKTIDILENATKRLEESNKSLQTEITESKVALSKANAALDSYRALGSVQQVAEAMSQLDKYRLLGTPRKIKEDLDQAEEVIGLLEDQVQDLTATIDQLKADEPATDEVTEDEDTSELDAYRELGTVEEIKACLERAEELLAEEPKEGEKEEEIKEDDEDEAPLSDIGSPEEIRALVQEAEEADSLLQQYQELGSVEELKEMCARLEEYGELEKEASAEDLAEEYDVASEVVKKLQDKGLSDDEIKDILDSMQNTVQGEEIDEDGEDDEPLITEDDEEDETSYDDEEDLEEDGSEDEDAYNVQKAVLGEARSSKALRARSRLHGRRVAESRRPSAVKAPKNTLLAQLLK